MTAFSELETYMDEHDLDSVIVGKHSVFGNFTALRTSRTRNLSPHHGAGDTAEAALRDLMDQDAGQPQVPREKTTANDDFEDLLG
jgi:hypothetical protein